MAALSSREVLPLRDVVLFPYVVMPLLVGRPASLAALESANESYRLVLLVAQRAGPHVVIHFQGGVALDARDLHRRGQERRLLP